jgi:hypothetical protein
MLFIFMAFVQAEPVDILLTSSDLKHYDSILEEALGSNNSVRLWVENANGQLLAAETALPEPVPVTEKYQFMVPQIGIDNPGSQQGFLSEKAVYLSQCHGWIYYDSLGRFSTQRGNLLDTVEDFHNPEGANQFLIQYLENAGANVFTAKERDLNSNMAISDNDAEGYFETGTGFIDGAAGYRDDSPWLYGENPFDAGTTRRFPADSDSVATWIPEVPVDGYYAVYVSWDSDSSNAPDAHYKITHIGGMIDRYYDQRVHGSTWQYVETLWLKEGVDSLTIELIADSSFEGTYLSADAIRIGGGMGDVSRYGTLTNRPRWEEGAILYTQFNGAPTSVYDPYNYGDGSDPSARSRWAAWEHPTGENAVYLSWHSNAGGGTGTDTYYDSSDPVDGSLELSTFVQEQIIQAIHTLHDAEWRDRGVKTANFAEVNSSYNNEMPSALVELAFHDSEYDIQFLLDPIFRRDASRAMYRGIVEYFAWQNGIEPVFLPEPPVGLEIVQQDGLVTVSWEDGLIGAPFGDAPASYVVYLSRDGRSWGNGTEVNSKAFTVEVDAGVTRYIRVASQNSGGISFPSETLAFTKELGDSVPPILFVSAFDRLQRSSLFWDEAGVLGSVRRMNLRKINSFDTLVHSTEAVTSLGYPFDSISDEQLSTIVLENYQMIIWVAGEESTYDSTFSQQDQEYIREYIENGGQLIVSGSEILWDLDYQGNATDKEFVADVLGATMSSDDADTYLAIGEGLLEGIEIDFSFTEQSPYNVEYPDTLLSDHQVIARYETGEIAGIYTGSVVLFGFPLETIISLQARIDIFEVLLLEMIGDYVPPVENDDTGSIGDLKEVDPDPNVDKDCGCDQMSPLQSKVLIPIVLWLTFRRRHCHQQKYT